MLTMSSHTKHDPSPSGCSPATSKGSVRPHSACRSTHMGSEIPPCPTTSRSPRFCTTARPVARPRSAHPALRSLTYANPWRHPVGHGRRAARHHARPHRRPGPARRLRQLDPAGHQDSRDHRRRPHRRPATSTASAEIAPGDGTARLPQHRSGGAIGEAIAATMARLLAAPVAAPDAVAATAAVVALLLAFAGCPVPGSGGFRLHRSSAPRRRRIDRGPARPEAAMPRAREKDTVRYRIEIRYIRPDIDDHRVHTLGAPLAVD